MARWSGRMLDEKHLVLRQLAVLQAENIAVRAASARLERSLEQSGYAPGKEK